MADPILERTKQFAIAIETTEGTAETLAASGVTMEIEEATANFIREMNTRNPHRTTLTKPKPIPGRGRGEISGRVELTPGETAASDNPPCHRVLQALGMKQFPVKTCDLDAAPSGTFIPGERITGDVAAEMYFISLTGTTMTYLSVTDPADSENLTGQISAADADGNATINVTAIGFGYMPTSAEADMESATACLNEGGIRTTIYGARGTGRFFCDGSGEIGYLEFTLSGTATKPTDQSDFSGTNVPSVAPEAFLSSAADVDGDTLCFNAVALELNNQVVERRCSDAATGIRAYRISDRDPKINIDPEVQLEAEHATFTKYDGATAFGFYCQIGSSAGKRFIICAAQATYEGIDKADREGIRTYNATLACTEGEEDVGDDEFLIAFT